MRSVRMVHLVCIKLLIIKMYYNNIKVYKKSNVSKVEF